MPPYLPFVSVVIPTMNRKDSLIETLDSIAHLEYPNGKVEIIVIDNGSTDETGVSSLGYSGNLKVIKNKKNLGFAKALNQGIKRSKGKFILITNDDVIFDRNCLYELVKVAHGDEKAGIVGPKMFFRDELKKMALPFFRVNLWLGYHPYDSSGKDRVREMDVATGGAMLVKKEVFEKVGYFDEGYLFCGEDYDFCFRAKYMDFKIMYAPAAIVWHEFLGSGQKSFDSLFAHFRGKFRFMFIHASIIQLAVFLPLQFVVGPIFSFFQSRQKTLFPIVSAAWWNIQNINSAIKSRKRVKALKEKFK